MRVLRAIASLTLIAAVVLASHGAAAGVSPSFGPSVRPPSDRPQVLATSRGGVLALPNGLHAEISDRHPVLRSSDPSTFSTLILFGEIKRRGHDYGFTVQIYRDDDPAYGRYTALFVGLGTGWFTPSTRTRAVSQGHLYERSLSDPSFRFRKDLTRARVDLGGQLGSWGTIDIRFRAIDPVETTCGGKVHTRTGTARGSVVFTPRHDNGFFGTIARARFDSAQLSSSTCIHPFPGGDGGSGCPAPYTIAEGDTFDGDRFRSFFASTYEFFPGMAYESVVAQEFWPRISVTHEIDAVVPRRWVKDDGDTVSWHGDARSFLPGAASVRATGDPYVDGPYPCDSGNVSAESFDGAFTGATGHPLTARFDTGIVRAPTEPDEWYGFLGRLVVTS
jgi:hypothetical protein